MSLRKNNCLRGGTFSRYGRDWLLKEGDRPLQYGVSLPQNTTSEEYYRFFLNNFSNKIVHESGDFEGKSRVGKYKRRGVLLIYFMFQTI